MAPPKRSGLKSDKGSKKRRREEEPEAWAPEEEDTTAGKYKWFGVLVFF